MTHDQRVEKLERESELTEKTYVVCHPVGRYLATKKGADPDAVTYQERLQFELYGKWAVEGKGHYSDLVITDELRQAGRDYDAAHDAKMQAYKASLPEGVSYFDDMMRRIRESKAASD